MAEFTTISLDTDVKEELDKQRNTPMGTISANDFLRYLLEQNKAKKKYNNG